MFPEYPSNPSSKTYPAFSTKLPTSNVITESQSKRGKQIAWFFQPKQKSTIFDGYVPGKMKILHDYVSYPLHLGPSCIGRPPEIWILFWVPNWWRHLRREPSWQRFGFASQLPKKKHQKCEIPRFFWCYMFSELAPTHEKSAMTHHLETRWSWFESNLRSNL